MRHLPAVLDASGQHLRHALRGLRRNLGWSAAAALSLALGIGANTAIFSWIDGLLLRPLPLPHADRLAAVWQLRLDDTGHAASPANFFEWRQGASSFAALAAYDTGSEILDPHTTGGEPLLVEAAHVSANFFTVAAVAPQLGRTFAVSGDSPAPTLPTSAPRGPREVVLGDQLWRQHFAADPGVLGRLIEIDRQPHVIVGVMPAGMSFPDGAEAWTRSPFDVPDLPFGGAGDIRQLRDAFYFSVIGRLHAGASMATARAEIAGLAKRQARDFPAADAHCSAAVVPLREALVGSSRPTLLLLAGAVACVLLIAAVNVAVLLLGRAAARGREIAIRTALGASRQQLLRHLLAEAFLLAALGGAGGLLLALPAARLSLVPVPAGLGDAAGLLSILSPSGVAFTLVLTLLVALGTGLAPALAAVRAVGGSALAHSADAGRRASQAAGIGRQISWGHARRGERLRGALVVAQTALALVLVSAAALMIGTLWRLQHADAGFAAAGRLAMRLDLPGAANMSPATWRRRFEQVAEGLAALPGVASPENVALINTLPLSGHGWGAGLRIEGRTFGPREAPAVCWRVVSPSYFHTLGIAVVRGRGFTAGDRVGSEPVALINSTLAKSAWPNENPVGRRIATGLDGPQGTWLRVAGVVADTPQDGIGMPVRPEIYRPLDQDNRYDGAVMRVVLRATPAAEAGDPMQHAVEVRARLRTLAPDMAVSKLRPLAELRDDAAARQRQVSVLLTLASAIALLLAAVGLYGTLSHGVQQRRHEMGIRLALGARRRQVVQLVAGRATLLLAAGALLGTAGALAVNRLLTSLLYGVQPADPLTLALAVAALLVAGGVAAYLPAARAARVDPTVTLRGD